MKIYLSEEQFIQLIDNGSITVGDISIKYNEEDDYCTKFNEIDTSKFVTLDTDQKITGKKTFSAEICVDQDGTSAAIVKLQDNSKLKVGNDALQLELSGSGVNPTYRDGYLALLTDIPNNHVTTDSSQTISGEKTFTNSVFFNNLYAADKIQANNTEKVIYLGSPLRGSGENINIDSIATISADNVIWKNKNHLWEYTFEISGNNCVVIFNYVGPQLQYAEDEIENRSIKISHLLTYITDGYESLVTSTYPLYLPAQGNLDINGHGKKGEIPIGIVYDGTNFKVQCCYVSGETGGLSVGNHPIIGTNNIFGSPNTASIITTRRLC